MPIAEYERGFGAILFEPTQANRELFGGLLSGQGIVTVGHRRFAPLSLIAPALDTGIDSGNVRSKLFYRENAVSRLLFPLIQGNQVIRYGVWWENPQARYRYVDVSYRADVRIKGTGRGGKMSGKGEYWRFRGPVENHHVDERLLMRQTEDEPFIGYINQRTGRVYTDNTIHTLLLTDEGRSSGMTYRYLLAVLNSTTLRQIYQAMTQEEGRVLAQVKTSVVNHLPIAVPSHSEVEQLDALVASIQRIHETMGLPLPLEASQRVIAVQQEIDEIVAQMYALSSPISE